MKNKIFILLIFTSVLSLSSCGLFSKKYLKTQTEDFRINTAGKSKFKLDNVRGSVTITHSNDSGALIIKARKEIKVKKKYLNTPFDEIKIKLDTISNIIKIETDVTKDREDSGFNFSIGREQRVDYEIQIPSGIAIDIENVSGNVTADYLDNDLKIDLVNGEVSLEKYTGRLECEIKNGQFSGHIDSTRGVSVSTINGSVTLYLNNFMNASVRAETVNGKITDENLKFKEVIKEKRLFKGKLGTGESNIDIKIETVNGKIRLYGRNEV